MKVHRTVSEQLPILYRAAMLHSFTNPSFFHELAL